MFILGKNLIENRVFREAEDIFFKTEHDEKPVIFYIKIANYYIIIMTISNFDN
jgi:hypothetical protein